MTPDPPPEPPPPTRLLANRPFVALWTAAGVSQAGSYVTRFALPFVAITALGAGPLEVGALRSSELVAALVLGFVAGAWVDRLRRRPLMIAADLGRAILLGSIPVAAIGGWLTLAQVIAVATLAAVLTTFFDVADRAYLPTIVARDDLVRANSTLSATEAGVEFVGFGLAGVLVQVLTAPIAVAIDAVSFVASALLLGTIRRREPPPPPAADREPILAEIREGLALFGRDPVLRGLLWGSMGLAGLWGVFGATYYLLAIEELRLDPAVFGVVVALGGVGSLVGALVTARLSRRYGLGRLVIVSLVIGAIANALIPIAPAGLPLVAIACLVGQQVVGDSAITMFDVTEVSVRQQRVDDRAMGRVNATARVARVLAQLAGTIAGGLLAEAAGLRVAAALAPACALLGALAVLRSPVRGIGRRAVAVSEAAAPDTP